MTATTIDETATLRIESAGDGQGVFSIPGTQYRLHLATEADLSDRVGQRIRGRITGHALRMHQASAGGNFIEPLDGRPRIVQGTVLAVDPSSNAVIVDLVVPFRLSIAEEQAPGMFASGEMVNFYVEPGCRFEAD